MRFRVRHVQRTIVDLLTSELTDRGWMSAGYLSTPVQIVEDVTFEDAPADLSPNTMAVTIEDEGADEHQQLGGGLLAVQYSLFVDMLGESGTMAARALSDVKDILRDRIVRVVDYAGETPVETDEQIEFEIIGIERPGSAVRATEMRRKWRVFTALAHVTFPEPVGAAGAGVPTWGEEPIFWGDDYEV